MAEQASSKFVVTFLYTQRSFEIRLSKQVRALPSGVFLLSLYGRRGGAVSHNLLV
jgi:hypothetical protein